MKKNTYEDNVFCLSDHLSDNCCCYIVTALSADGMVLASTSHDEIIQLWDLSCIYEEEEEEEEEDDDNNNNTNSNTNNKACNNVGFQVREDMVGFHSDPNEEAAVQSDDSEGEHTTAIYKHIENDKDNSSRSKKRKSKQLMQRAMKNRKDKEKEEINDFFADL